MLLSARLAGLAILAVVWLGPLPGLAIGSMTAHMVLHLAVVAVAPALLARPLPGAPGPVLLGAAVVVEMLVVWGWHAPDAHVWARLSGAGFALEQASFLFAGMLLWSVALGAGRLGSAAILLFTSMHMTLLGALLGLAPRPLYDVYCTGLLGLGPLEDQQVAGAVMAGLGGLVYMVSGLARLAPALGDHEPGVRR